MTLTTRPTFGQGAERHSPERGRGGRAQALATTGCFILLALHPSALATQEPGAPEGAAIEVPGDASPAQLESLEARLRAALQLSPHIAAFHASLADVLLVQGRVADARAALADAVRLSPSDVEYRAELGRAHLALEEWVEAEINFEWGARLAPENAGLHAGLGEALLGQERYEEAAEVYATAAEIDPGDQQIVGRATAAEALARAARDSTPSARDASLLDFLLDALRYASAVVLTIAGIGLLLPVIGALLLLFIAVPAAFLRQRPFT